MGLLYAASVRVMHGPNIFVCCLPVSPPMQEKLNDVSGRSVRVGR
jgi:hypothetical protein